jgi:hypothetical protein
MLAKQQRTFSTTAMLLVACCTLLTLGPTMGSNNNYIATVVNAVSEPFVISCFSPTLLKKESEAYEITSLSVCVSPW